jgi:glycosyltransferase involved in cell wall biosynthesis
MRRTYADLGDERRRFGNPYRVEGERSFLAWLAAPHTPGSPLSNLALTLYRARPDVVHAYPDVKGTHQEAFLEWMVDHSREDFGLGENLFEPIRAALRALRAGQALAPSEEAAPARPASESLSISGGPGGGPPFGINLVGYFDTESGVGEIARSVARMVEASGIPHVLVNLEQPWLRRGDRTFTSFSTAAPYAVNVVLVNADQTPAVFDRLGLRRAPGTYNVGYWFWELSRFPARFSPAFEWVDEVWVASDFCLDAISRETRRPVVKIRPAFEPVAPGRKRRRQFALSESEFVFLYVFDAASVLKRKNPAGAIRAFRRAFRPEANARLLLKTTGAPPKTLAALERLSGDARVSIWNDYLDRGDLLDLVAASDAYVSPHRSEGFGLTLLEALLMGKPAVATNYGGVREFIDLPNVRSIKCREVFLAQDAGPYPAGSAWAEPDVEDAAAMMREVLEAGTGPSAAARATVAEIRRRFGLPSTTAALVQRLGLIRSWIERGPS